MKEILGVLLAILLLFYGSMIIVLLIVGLLVLGALVLRLLFKRPVSIILLIAVLFYFIYKSDDENIIFFDKKISDLMQDTDIGIIKLNDLTKFPWTVAYFKRAGVNPFDRDRYKLTFFDKTNDKSTDIVLNKKYYIFGSSEYGLFNTSRHEVFYPESMFIFTRAKYISKHNSTDSINERIPILVLDYISHNMFKNIFDAINFNNGAMTANNLLRFDFRFNWDRLDIYVDDRSYRFRFIFKNGQIRQYFINRRAFEIHQNILNDKCISIYPDDILKFTSSDIFILDEILRETDNAGGI